MIDVPVLVVGGGPVGLTASLYLSLFGIESLLVERHPGTAILPKARALNARTMEMYRQIDLEDAIRAVAMPDRFGGTILWSESLAGREIKRLHPGRGSAANQALSIAGNCGCSQDILEPVLRQRAEAAGPGRLRFGTALRELNCDADGVTATIEDAEGRGERLLVGEVMQGAPRWRVVPVVAAAAVAEGQEVLERAAVAHDVALEAPPAPRKLVLE